MFYKKKFNTKFFYSIIILIFSISVNQYFGYFGVNPLDNFTIYNSGYLILEKQVPFNDYWVITGPLLDYLQAFFLKFLASIGQVIFFMPLSLIFSFQ